MHAPGCGSDCRASRESGKLKLCTRAKEGPLILWLPQSRAFRAATPTAIASAQPKVEPGVTTQVAVKIRLKRMGKIRAPYYRVVVVDSRKKRDGRVIEEIGKYHPTENPSLIEIDSDRAQYWLSVGAQPTPPVLTQLKITGDWQKFKGLPGAEGRLKVKDSGDVETRRKAAVESAQNEAERRRAEAAAARSADSGDSPDSPDSSDSASSAEDA